MAFRCVRPHCSICNSLAFHCAALGPLLFSKEEEKTEIGIHLGMQRCSLTLQARGNHLNKPPMHSAVFNLHFALILPWMDTIYNQIFWYYWYLNQIITLIVDEFNNCCILIFAGIINTVSTDHLTAWGITKMEFKL